LKKADEKKFGTLSEFFLELSKSTLRRDFTTLYRGHSSEGYKLTPSIFRKKEYRSVERHILRELLAIQPNEFRDDKTAFEQLVRMQHYGLPTRLLDLTYNPLVGLYFACSGESDLEKDGEIIRLTVRRLNIKYFDSDTVSCVANLSNLTGDERDALRRLHKKGKKTPEGQVAKRLLHFIATEKPYFEPRIRLDDLMGIYVVRPKQTNRRILAQQGAFLIFGLRSNLEDSNEWGIEITRTTVPASFKKDLLHELDGININGGALFPEIESAAKYIISKIPIQEPSENLLEP
jgi:hypothetical protein